SFRDGGVAVPSARTPALLSAPPTLDLRWTEAARRYARNRQRVMAVYDRVRALVEEIKQKGVHHARGLLPDLDDGQVLDDHQLVNVAAMAVADSPGLCIFDEQGAGKTVTLIFGFDLLVKRGLAELVLVVAPKSMVPEWPKDLARFKGDLYRCETLAGTR